MIFLNVIKGLIFYNLIFLHAIMLGHGFGANTLIELADGSKKTIYTLCLQSLKSNPSIISYDIDIYTIVTQQVTIGKKSTSNCYIQLGFDRNSNDNDIFCTPTQEFYVTHSNQWVSAYLLKIGDPLLTKNGEGKHIAYKKFVPKPITIYMLEVENTHTFFVGKYSVLTHNMLLPLTASIGFVIPFGGVTSGGIGSFFGPIGLIGGIAVGGLIGFAAKILYEKRIPCYKTPSFDVSLIHNNCHTTISSNDTLSKPSGCFEKQDLSHTTHIYPIERPIQTKVGCVEIQTYIPNKSNSNSCSKTEQPKINKQGCFQSAEQKPQSVSRPQEKNSTVKKPNNPNQRPTARNWKEFEENCPMGQKYGKKFLHTGKQNPKDNSPIRQLSENVPNAEMFKKGYFFALDRFHAGDHFEVWDKNGKWIGVSNLDGSRNEKKSTAEVNQNSRNLRK